MLSSMNSASTVSCPWSPGPDGASDSLYKASLCLMQHHGIAGLQNGDVPSMLKIILDQNYQILAQNADMNARLAEVEKLQQQQRLHPSPFMRIRPRAKGADGCVWSCPVCSLTLKHFDSYLSHIRKLAVCTVHRQQCEKHAKCRFILDKHEHLLLLSPFPGDDGAAKAASFASHFLHVCRTISGSTSDAAEKHKRISEWLRRVIQDPSFVVAGDCPVVSDMSSPTSLEQSSSSDAQRQSRVWLGGRAP